MSEPVIGRLAPSPTGRLHLGHARSFLAAWWSARHAGGSVVLRIEDLDESRSRPEYVQGILEDLAWLGLDWDGAPILQTDLQAQHEAALARLVAAGRAYPCVCTRRDIERAASAPHLGETGPVYPGTCRGRFSDAQAAWRASGREPAWRLNTQGIGVLRWSDELLGPQVSDLEAESGDFVIWTKAGRAAYQLGVVVDDAAAGVNQVVRGEDLVLSTFQQLALMRELDITPPRWWHLALVGDPDGRRLAKRSGAHSLSALREQGVDPFEIVAWAAQSLGMAGRAQSAASFAPSFAWPTSGPQRSNPAVAIPAAWAGV